MACDSSRLFMIGDSLLVNSRFDVASHRINQAKPAHRVDLTKRAKLCERTSRSNEAGKLVNVSHDGSTVYVEVGSCLFVKKMWLHENVMCNNYVQ